MGEQLLIQCGDHWENQCRILPLARALKAAGHAPNVMTYSPTQGALFLAHGIPTCPLDLERRSPASTRWRDRLETRLALKLRPLGYPHPFVETVNVEKMRAPARFSSGGKMRKRGISIVRHERALKAILRELEPAHVFIWNGRTGAVANLLRTICQQRGITTSFLERGLFPDSVFIDPEGTNGESALSKTQQLPPAADSQVELPVVEPGAASERLRRRYCSQGRRLIFLPLQVQADTNILFYSDVFKTMRELVTAVAEGAPEDAIVIARPHPEEVERDLGLPTHPRVRYVATGEIDDWVDAADLTVTINSTVGLTALLRRRPVLSLGRGIYTQKGLTTEASQRDLTEVLHAPETYAPPETEAVRRFYALLVDHHTVLASGRNLGVPTIPSSGRRTRERAGRPARLDVGLSQAGRLAERWTASVVDVRKRIHGGTRAHIWARIGPSHTLNLTYRKTSVDVTREHILDGVALLLDCGQDALTLSKRAEMRSDDDALIVIQPQSDGNVPPNAALVLDQYNQPHVGWLLGKQTAR